MRISVLAFAVLVSVFAHSARAALKVDLDPDVDRKDILTPGCASWKIADGTTASQKFGDLTITLRGIGGPLAADWWRRGYDFRSSFASDGAYVRAENGPGQIELTL